ncbi:MAG: hypothetical protein RIE86_03900 [Imperialibacter sp.]|uniref:hypothetical protein n=1 Tax=Imperialibacter sp. TaxID=2038411 RepID=UPI0032ECF63C
MIRLPQSLKNGHSQLIVSLLLRNYRQGMLVLRYWVTPLIGMVAAQKYETHARTMVLAINGVKIVLQARLAEQLF